MKIRLNRKAVRSLLVVLAVAVVFCVLFCLLRAWDRSRNRVEPSEMTGESIDLYPKEDKPLSYINGKWYAPRDDIETVLLLGLDKFEESIPAESSDYINNRQADFLLLLLIDRDDQTYTALHLNRDTMAEIRRLGLDGKPAGTKLAQLTLAHTYGSGGTDSCENTVTAVSSFLYGAPIDHYISLTMDAVAEVNDLCGGVTVSVLDDFSSVDGSLVQGAEITLSGTQALTYVRARSGLEDSSNVRRMERQRQYLHALHEQVEKKLAESEDFLVSAILEISPYLVSDCSIYQLADLGSNVMEYRDEGIRTIEGEAVKGERFMEFHADDAALRDLVLELFYTEAEN